MTTLSDHAASAACYSETFSRVTDTLDKREIERYSRQLLLPEFGVKGQIALHTTAVLVVGCGGLGSPVAIYLAAAGIGRLGLVDYDEVEVSNLHRQILHSEDRIGQTKCTSAATTCTQLNSRVTCIPYHIALNSDNASEIIQQYDIVVDATDNVATRYLLNDACVLAHKPLVSGSALRFEGQLTVYNYKDSPCYRCLFPTPPPADTVQNCSDSGVFGPVVGMIGSLQALEVLKIAVGFGTTYAGRLLLFDGLDGTTRCIKLRGKQPQCIVCGDSPSITKLIDYEQFCGAKATDKVKEVHLLDDSDRISVEKYHEVVTSQERHLLIDVREPVELDMCKLPTTTHNFPMNRLDSTATTDELRSCLTPQSSDIPIFVVCRRGNDSQLAVAKLRRNLSDLSVTVRDIRGGLHAWARHIDDEFPVY